MKALMRPSRKALRAMAQGLVVVGLIGWALPAWAWVCSRVSSAGGIASGPAFYWPSRTIPFVFGAGGTNEMDTTLALNTVRKSLAVWSNSTLRPTEAQSCPSTAVAGVPTATDLKFVEGAPSNQTFVGYDYLNPNINTNLFIFRDTGWDYPLTGDSTESIAMTTLTYNTITGAIIDADIEFNSFDFAFSTSDSNVVFDLMNAASHEVGHFLGFAHSLDETATMYKSAKIGETLKRQLSCDDAAILWFRYPDGAPTTSCQSYAINKSCGFCAPPGTLAYRPTVQVIRSSDGHGGCNCQSAGADGYGLMGGAALSWAIRTFKRRRPRPCRLSPAAKPSVARRIDR